MSPAALTVPITAAWLHLSQVALVTLALACVWAACWFDPNRGVPRMPLLIIAFGAIGAGLAVIRG